MNITFGTKGYKIPHIKKPLPLSFCEGDDGFSIVCPYLTEWGFGKTYPEAFEDLTATLAELHGQCQQFLIEGKSLSLELQRIIDLWDE